MKSKHYLTVFICIMIYSSNSLIGQELISNGGDHYKNNNQSMEWSLGEIMIDGYLGNYSLTQGFHQGEFIISSISEGTEYSTLEISAFPNPVVDYLNITITPFKHSSIKIYNSIGQLVLSIMAESETSSIDLNQFSADSYIVQVLNPEARIIKAFQLSKINY